MSLPRDGADALRECARILARWLSPAERATMALNVEARIKSGDWTPVFRLPHVAALFYPKDDRRAAELLASMERARETGALPSTLPASERGATMSDLAAWVECPPVPADSPLRYWLPQTMHGAEVPPRSHYRLEAWHLNDGIDAQLLRGMLAATPGEIRDMYGVSPEEAALSLRCYELASLPAWDHAAMLDAATAQSLEEEQRLLWGLESRDALGRRIALAMRAEGAPELLHPADAVLLLERHGIRVFHELREAVRRRTLSGEALSEEDVRRYRALSGTIATDAEEPEPAPNEAGAAGEPDRRAITHRLQVRRNDLGPAIDAALARASNPTDNNAVWVAFLALADSPEPMPPLLGVAEGDVKYRTARGVKCITRDAFIKRLKYAANKRD